jgi:DNA invertase Pin-like site-specific DNA recombinase
VQGRRERGEQEADRCGRACYRLFTPMGRIIDTLKTKDVGLRILNMNFDTASPTGKMMLTILGSIAEFEREIMLERQREGIAKAQSEGKYRGRAPTARAKADQVFALDRAGKTREAIAKEVEISLVYRIFADSQRCRESTGCTAGHSSSDTSASQRIIEEG